LCEKFVPAIEVNILIFIVLSCGDGREPKPPPVYLTKQP
jgi:hypothetical protein